MAIPNYQILMLPVLRLATADEQRVADAAERIADNLGLSPDVGVRVSRKIEFKRLDEDFFAEDIAL